MDRREFLNAGVAGLGLVATGWADEAVGSFDFIFFTDTHIQPELAAAEGCQMCFRKIRSIRADFAIQGGDHVFDALAVGRPRADKLFDLYKQTEQALEIPIYHTIGNHDVFGVAAASGISVNDPAYGKGLYEDKIGRRTYHSFTHKGYRFVVLDSIQPTPDRNWEARIDEQQVDWLKGELGKTAARTPTVVIVHVPLVTASSSYAPSQKAGEYQTSSVGNAYEVLPLFRGHNILGVLQGHTHINEVVEWQGIPYITRGAVCGNWWHGTRWGTPEGFTIVRLRNGKMSWSYETYGFKSVDPKNT